MRQKWRREDVLECFGFFVPIHADVVNRLALVKITRNIPARIARRMLFHLDDLRPKIPLDHDRRRSRHQRRQIDDSNPLQ